MKRDPRRPAFVVAIAAVVATAPAAAAALGSSEAGTRLAYVDPGSGSFILQALVAALAGMAVAVNAYWRKIKQILGFGSPKQDDDAAEPPSNDD